MNYVVANISGRLNEFLQWKEKNNISNSQIIIGGNFIGKYGSQEIIDYMYQNFSSFQSVLSGPLELSLVDWSTNELLEKNHPSSNPYLLDKWFNFNHLTKDTIHQDIAFLKKLKSNYLNVNANDEYFLHDKFKISVCSVLINDTKIYLRDNRTDISICSFD